MMRRLLRRFVLSLAALVFAVSQLAAPVRADGFSFDMETGGSSFGTLIVCKDGRTITGTIEADGRVLCGPALFVRTGVRQGRLECGDGTVLQVGQLPGTILLAWSYRGSNGFLRRIR